MIEYYIRALDGTATLQEHVSVILVVCSIVIGGSRTHLRIVLH